MYIYNVHINGKRIFRIALIIMILLILLLFIFVVHRIFYNNKFKVSDNLKSNDIQEISFNDYTNVLRSSYEDIDSYVGVKIKFTGYVYRLIDFKDTEFVLARDMKLDKTSNETFVVGFLCDFEGVKNFKDNEWVEIIGEVTKDKYHNEDIPLIKILKMKKTSKPNEDKLFVPGPDNTYIPTSAMF